MYDSFYYINENKQYEHNNGEKDGLVKKNMENMENWEIWSSESDYHDDYHVEVNKMYIKLYEMKWENAFQIDEILSRKMMKQWLKILLIYQPNMRFPLEYHLFNFLFSIRINIFMI